MGKGSKKRPCSVPRKLEEMRWKLALNKISFKEYEIWYKAWKKNKSEQEVTKNEMSPPVAKEKKFTTIISS